MKIHLLTCFYQRQDVTQAFLSRLRNLRKDFDIDYTFVVSGTKDKEFLQNLGYTSHYHANIPVSNKHNYGLSIAMTQSFDYLIIMGSDDLISHEGLHLLTSSNKDYVGFDKIVFTDLCSGKTGLFTQSPRLIGCGRMISKKALEHTLKKAIVRPRKNRVNMNWSLTLDTDIHTTLKAAKYLEDIGHFKTVHRLSNGLWDNGLNSGLDNSSEINLALNGFHPEVIKSDKHHLIDVKSEVNITKFTRLELKEVENPFWFLEDKEIEYLDSIKRLKTH